MHHSSLDNFFIQQGESFVIELGYRLFVHDEHHLIFVESGDLDMFVLTPIGTFAEADHEFFVRLSEENRLFLGELIAGPLFFLCNVTTGNLLYPFKPLPGHLSHRVLLKANSKSVLRKIPIKKVLNVISNDKELKNAYFERCDESIALIYSITRNFPHRTHLHYLDPGLNEISQLNCNLSIPRHRHEFSLSLINWCKVLEGSAFLMGKKGVEAVQESPFIPMHPLIWIQNTTPITLEVLPNSDLLTPEEHFKAMFQLYQNILKVVSFHLSKTRETGQELLAKKEFTEEHKLKTLFDYLGNILTIKKTFNIIYVGNRLFETCQMIGKAIGRKFAKPAELKGTDPFSNTYEICVASKIQSRRIFLKGDWWKQASNPLLVFKKDSKTPERAALSNSKGEYSLYDPEEPLLSDEVNNATKAEAILPKGILFYRSFPKDKRVSFWQILEYIGKNRGKDIALLCLVVFLSTVLLLFLPFFNKFLYDLVIPDSDRNLLIQLMIGLSILAISIGLLSFTREMTILRLETLITHDLETAFWTKALTLPISFFRRFSVGSLYLQLSSINTIKDAISGGFSRLAINSLFFFIYLIPMFYLNATLSFLAILSLIVISIIGAVAFNTLLKIQEKITNVRSLITGKVLQIISGISKIRIYGVESRIFNDWGLAFGELQNLELKKGFIYIFISTLARTAPTAITMITLLGVLYVYYPSKDSSSVPMISIGNLIAFTTLYFSLMMTILNFWETLTGIVYIFPIWKLNRPLLDELPEIKSDEFQEIQLRGSVEFSNIYFRYAPDLPYIHRNVSIHADPGEMIAIVGKAGCGKSTLFRLLLGFEKPESGGVFVDEKDINSLDLQQLRRQIGIISQNSKVMDGTIRDNITGGSICTQEQVERAIKLSCFDDVLEQLPMRLQTYISHGCDTLSGGQLQRLFIARALVNNPKILLMDEATNALDNTTQERITKNIDALNITRIVIAHRLSTIREADRIYVMENGAVIESGSYEELMKLNKKFAMLVKLQALV